MTRVPSVAVLWRGDRDARRTGIASNDRLRPVFHALEDVGLEPRPVVHRDEIAAVIREELLALDGVLVWVDPLGRGEDRRRLDAILRDVSAGGVWVSAHPDVVQAMGTKEVLHRTRDLGWGTDVERYETPDELCRGLRARLVDGPRVLKPRYGNGGIGVWKVERATSSPTITADTMVRVQGAEVRDTSAEEIPLSMLLERCAAAFADGGCIIDQPFQPRVSEGMVRCYLVADQVVGFARQTAADLLTVPGAEARIMGLPSAKTMLPSDEPDLGLLRALVEGEWVPAMCDLLGLARDDLPVLWDADFLLATSSDTGQDSYVLCEINCSCVTPFPPGAPTHIARAAREHVVRVSR